MELPMAREIKSSRINGVPKLLDYSDSKAYWISYELLGDTLLNKILSL
jgi:hypothetical protein